MSVRLRIWCAGPLAAVVSMGCLLVAQEPPKRADKNRQAEITAEQREQLEAEAKRLWEEGEKLDEGGKVSEAIAKARQALAIERRIFGNVHDEVAGSLEWLASRYQQLTDYETTKALLLEAQRIRRQLHGEQHWQATDVRYALERVQRLIVLSAAKRRQLQAAVAKSDEALGLHDEGKHQEAIRLARDAINILKSALGESHPNYAEGVGSLAELYDEAGDRAGAERLLKQAVEILKRTLGVSHPDYARSLSRLGGFYNAKGDHALAEPLFRQTIDIDKKALGEQHPDLATDLNDLGRLYQTLGDVQRAEPLLKQAAEIRKGSLGETDPEYAVSLNNLASLYEMKGDYAGAEPLFRRAVGITKEALGEQHPDYATSLNNLANFYITTGSYAQVEPLLLQSREIRKNALGEAHPEYAATLNNLAGLYESMGDYARAEPLFRQALEIKRNALGEAHPDFALGLNNLAALYTSMGEYARAEPLCRQALEIRKKTLGEMHPDYAQSLTQYAKLVGRTAKKFHVSMKDGNFHYQIESSGDHKKVEPLLREALEITKRALGEAHPTYAANLANLADLYESLGEYARAAPLYELALEINKKALGEQHPDHAMGLINLARLYDTMGEREKSESKMRDGLAISRRVVEQTAAAQSERQQLAMAERLRYQLISYLVRATVPTFRDSVYPQLLAWKGAVLARQRAMTALRDNPQLQPIYGELERVTAQLARQSFATPREGQRSAWQKEIAALSDQKERLERQLASASGLYRQAQRAITLETLRAALPEDGVLIDIFESDVDVAPDGAGAPLPPDVNSEVTGLKVLRAIERRYLAFLVRKTGSIDLVLLPKPNDVETQLEAWRADFGQSANSRAAGLWLREHLWRPLEEHLGNAKLVLISPDGSLGKLPFAALPGREPGSYLLEEDQWLIAMIPSAAALPGLTADSEAKKTIKSLLVVGGVDYDRVNQPRLATTSSAKLPRPLNRAPRDSQVLFDPLPGTQEEVATITSAYEARGFDKSLLTTLQKGAATEQALRSAAPQHKYLHFATHGFFAPPRFKAALDRTTQDETTTGQGGLASEQSISGYHPNLLSGIVLAGANHPPEEGDDGILTAEEVGTLDLRAAELVVLSACETGIGKTAGGEGLLGLQRAFQGAGAKTVVASLWSVPDEATKVLMVRFYENLWKKKMGKLEALREAQLWLLKEGAEQPEIRRELAARGLATIEAGAGSGDPRTTRGQEPGKSRGRLPAYFWAAWVLSGDWR